MDIPLCITLTQHESRYVCVVHVQSCEKLKPHLSVLSAVGNAVNDHFMQVQQTWSDLANYKRLKVVYKKVPQLSRKHITYML